MPRLPAVTAAEAIRVFKKLGFVVDRTRGSHHQMKKPGHLYVLTIPDHGNSTIKAGTLRQLIRASGMTVEEFVERLQAI